MIWNGKEWNRENNSDDGVKGDWLDTTEDWKLWENVAFFFLVIQRELKVQIK